MGRRIILVSLVFFVAFTSAVLLGLLSFIPGPIATIIAVSSLLFLLVSRFQYYTSGKWNE